MDKVDFALPFIYKSKIPVAEDFIVFTDCIYDNIHYEQISMPLGEKLVFYLETLDGDQLGVLEPMVSLSPNGYTLYYKYNN